MRHVLSEIRKQGWSRLGPAGYLVGIAFLATLIILNISLRLDTSIDRADNTIVERADVLYVPSVKMTRILGLGYDQAMADLQWLRTVDYFVRHFDTDRRYKWLEHFIDQVLELDPQFRKVYHWAGANVLYGRRFTNKNVRRSNHFYLKAIDKFPEDYEAAYRLGLNYYVELRSDDPEERKRFKEKGLSYLEMAANIPGSPAHLRSMVASISNRLGKKQVALQYLIDLYLRTDEPEAKTSLRHRIAQLKMDSSGDEVALEAERFQKNWKATFAYVAPTFYATMGEPTEIIQPDVSWRMLMPDILVQSTTANDKEGDAP